MASTINISLPDKLMTYVDAQTAAGHFDTPSEYIRELILEDRARHQRGLEDHLLAALAEESQAVEIPEEILDDGDIVGWMEEQAKSHK